MLRLSCSDDLAQRGQQPLYFLDGVVVHEADAEETAEALDIQLFGEVQGVVVSIPGKELSLIHI